MPKPVTAGAAALLLRRLGAGTRPAATEEAGLVRVRGRAGGSIAAVAAYDSR